MSAAEGLRLATEGAEKVLAADLAVHRDFAPWVRAAVRQLVAVGDPFTSDDVRRVMHGPVLDAMAPNLIGAVMRDLAVKGEVRREGFSRSTRSSRHGAWLAVWVPGGAS